MSCPMRCCVAALLALASAPAGADTLLFNARIHTMDAQHPEAGAMVWDEGGKLLAVGDALTLADLSVSCGLNIWQAALGGVLPAGLKAYQERLALRPAYQRAVARCAATGT